MKFELQNQDGHARAGLLKTQHGEISTPVFMPVGTYGAVKSIAPKELEETNFEIILGNVMIVIFSGKIKKHRPIIIIIIPFNANTDLELRNILILKKSG